MHLHSIAIHMFFFWPIFNLSLSLRRTASKFKKLCGLKINRLKSIEIKHKTDNSYVTIKLMNKFPVR